ncbi:MAG: thiamine-phosphate kinase [Gemmatimonadales bacterium]|jgi:thiamine-monophosphate kinase
MTAQPPGARGHAALGAGAEFDRIRAMLERLGGRASPSGDDCAFVDLGGETLAISTDMVVEGTHFRAGWLSPPEIGWRAGAAALSDLAAVAAVPKGVLASVGAPRGWSESVLADLLEGIGTAAASVGASVWGGDLVRSDRLVVDLVVVGVVGGGAGEAVRRSTGRVGDTLWVTGVLGGPLAALRAWQAGREADPSARERFVHPVPRVREAQWLRDRGATALIDLSDGLFGDAGHVAAASGVRCAVELERLPLHGSAESRRDALLSGEEYELLVALPRDFGDDDATEFADQFDLPLTRIGELREGTGVVVMEGGEPVEVGGGYGHY